MEFAVIQSKPAKIPMTISKASKLKIPNPTFLVKYSHWNFTMTHALYHFDSRTRSQKDKIRAWYPSNRNKTFTSSENTRLLEKIGHTPNFLSAKDGIFKRQVLYVKNNTEYFHSRRNFQTKKIVLLTLLESQVSFLSLMQSPWTYFKYATILTVV